MPRAEPMPTPTAMTTKQGFLSLSQLPTVGYTMQNIVISFSSMVASLLSLVLTICIFLPLSIARNILVRVTPSSFAVGQSREQNPAHKVVLIVGASRGIGFNVLKQYMNEKETVILAASRSIDSVRNMVVQLGDTAASLQCTELDLTGTRKQITERIRDLDKQYGPITHLYEVSGITTHLNQNQAWGSEATADIININVSGTVASVLAVYELMRARSYGKICIVGSLAGLYSPANMISYAATKAFINTFTSSLRVLGARHNIEVVSVLPGFIDTRMTKAMRNHGTSVPKSEFASAEGMAQRMKEAVEEGGVGVVTWPTRQSAVIYGLRSVNPICEELGRWLSMQLSISGKKTT